MNGLPARQPAGGRDKLGNRPPAKEPISLNSNSTRTKPTPTRSKDAKSIGHPVDAGVREALLSFQEEDWREAIESDGTDRERAQVAELTDLMDLSTRGEDARLICRRERPHPGAQLSLFDTSEGFRHTCFITNVSALNFDPAVLECRHRGHARVEDRVRCWKDCGLQNLPFVSFTQNLAWVATSLVAWGADRLGANDLPRRRAQKGRAEDDPQPIAPCRRHPRAARAAPHLAAGRDLAVG